MSAASEWTRLLLFNVVRMNQIALPLVAFFIAFIKLKLLFYPKLRNTFSYLFSLFPFTELILVKVTKEELILCFLDYYLDLMLVQNPNKAVM